MRMLLFIPVFVFAAVSAETTRTTCVTDALKKEECIKTVCDEKGECTDSLLDKQSNKTSPIQIAPEAIQLALQNIDSLNKDLLKLSDGSVWNVQGQNVSKAQQWLENKPVSVYLTHPVTARDANYRLVNVNNNEAITIVYDNSSFTGDSSEIKRTIISLDQSASHICLSDGSCWEYDPFFIPQPVDKVIVAGNPVLIGANSTFFREAFPNTLMLLQVAFPPKSIAVKPMHKN